ncbi:15774_t:CDS:2 [Gigaspora margarita]|uniref:15774_t:CDS:1 n=1 Tax=Gigaspora margarita TaxID=4874 RepID=A0ABN7UTA4_GIGMA|nr:15774_t:CDS:2 [Gigaspora margarita]
MARIANDPIVILAYSILDVKNSSTVTLDDVSSYFPKVLKFPFNESNISEAFKATKNNQGVITLKEWPTFLERFYSLLSSNIKKKSTQKTKWYLINTKRELNDLYSFIKRNNISIDEIEPIKYNYQRLIKLCKVGNIKGAITLLNRMKWEQTKTLDEVLNTSNFLKYRVLNT